MKNTKLLSLLLALLMIVGSVSVFPTAAAQNLDAISAEIKDIVPLENLAPNATYKGEGMDNGTSGNYCEAPGTDWEVYHTGKLNDGEIPTTDAQTSLGKNVEFWTDGYCAGTINVTFKFDTVIDVKQVNVYMNDRDNNENCDYPTKIEVFVNDSESLVGANLMGEATTTDTDYVRNYTVSNEYSGSYVIIQFTSGDKYRITCSEIEILGVDTGVSVGGGDVEEPDNYYIAVGGCEFFGSEWDPTDRNNELILNTETGIYEKVYYNVPVGSFLFMVATNGSWDNNYNLEGSANNGGDTSVIDITEEGYSVIIGFDGTKALLTITNDPPAVKLAAPVINDLPASPLQTFDAPTISWTAVEGATAYDVYLDGTRIKENLTETTYTLEMDPVISYLYNTDYSKATVVAKGDGDNYSDSDESASFNFFFVKVPTDLRGNELREADIIIDPGHGGVQPGAVNGDRQEKDDTLAMSLRLGQVFESLGYTVAFCRIEDVDDGLMARAAKVNTGNYDLFICIHRNSYTTTGVNGIEVLYETNDPLDQAYAQYVLDEFVDMNVWTNRGLKPRDNLVVLNNTVDTVPSILVELGFISNIPIVDSIMSDNQKFDTYFDDLALAMVKGSMKYQEYKTGFEGKLTVEGTEYPLSDSEETLVEIECELNSSPDGDGMIRYNFELANGLGIDKLYYSYNSSETLTELEIFDSEWVDCTYDGYWFDKMFKSANLDIPTDVAGTSSLTFYAKSKVDEMELYSGMEKLFTLQYTITSPEEDSSEDVPSEDVPSEDVPSEDEPALDITYGDVNNDGFIDSLDAAQVLKYDAMLTELSEDALTAADVNGDGVVDSLDAAQILKFDAMIIDSFPIEQ